MEEVWKSQPLEAEPWECITAKLEDAYKQVWAAHGCISRSERPKGTVATTIGIYGNRGVQEEGRQTMRGRRLRHLYRRKVEQERKRAKNLQVQQ